MLVPQDGRRVGPRHGVKGRTMDAGQTDAAVGNDAEEYLVHVPSPMNPNLPQIDLNDYQLAEAMLVVESSIERHSNRKRGNRPRLLARGEVWVDTNADMRRLTKPDLVRLAARLVRFVRVKQTKEGAIVRGVEPPRWLGDHLLNRPPSRIGQLIRVAKSPFLWRGEIIRQAGHHAPSRTWLEPGACEGVEGALSVAEAVERIDDLYHDFDFPSPADRAGNYAALLAPLVSTEVGLLPMFVYMKGAHGVGATLLANVASWIGQGERPLSKGGADDFDEQRKTITSALLTRPHGTILLDNVNRIGGEHLARLMTELEWTDRVLGESRDVTVANHAIWFASAKNPVITKELTRRIVPINTARDAAEPERYLPEGGWRHPWLENAAMSAAEGFPEDKRRFYLEAVLSLLARWVEAGMPEGRARMGSYDRFARVVGGILDHAGVKGFLDNRDLLIESASVEHSGWNAFFGEWLEEFGGNPVTVNTLFSRLLQAERGKLPRCEYPVPLSGSSNADKSRSLSAALRREVGTVYVVADVGGVKVQRVEVPKGRNSKYRLVGLNGDLPAANPKPANAPRRDDCTCGNPSDDPNQHDLNCDFGGPLTAK